MDELATQKKSIGIENVQTVTYLDLSMYYGNNRRGRR